MPWKENPDPGAVLSQKLGYWQLTEREITKRVAKRLYEIFLSKTDELGILSQNIIQIGIETDATVEKKTAYANSVIEHNGWNPVNCFSFSLHCNPDYGPNVEGVEGYYQKAKPYNSDMLSFILGGKALTGIRKYFPNKKFRSVMSSQQEARWHRLYIDDYKTNAFLIEMGFLGSKMDVDDMWAKTPDQMAESIANGIMEFFRSAGIS